VNIPEKYRDAEAVIFTAYPFDQQWIGEKTAISLQQIRAQLSDPLILRYAGDLDENFLINKGVRFFPLHVHSGHMGILPSAIGYDPIIRLQAGGLKVGEALLNGKYEYRNLKILDLV
jgi:hypothetical protein